MLATVTIHTATLAVAIHVGALELGGRAELRVESRLGHFTEGLSPTPAFGAAGEVTPGLTLSGREGRRLAFDVRYAPQLLVKSGAIQPGLLTLHDLEASLVRANRRGDLVRVALTAISGALDYGRAARTIAAQGALPAFPRGALVSYSNVDLYGQALHRPSRRLTHQLMIGAGYTGPEIGEDDRVVLEQLRSLILARSEYRLSRRDEVSLETQLSAVTFERGPTYFAAAPALGYSRRLSRTETLRARAGAQITNTRGRVDPGGDPGYSIEPVGTLALSSTSRWGGGRMLTLDAAVNLSPFYDPFRGVLVPRAITEATAAWRAERGTDITVRMQWYEPLPKTAPAGGGYDLREQRLIALGLALERRLAGGLTAELGGVGLGRWGDLESAAGFAEPELLGFFAIKGVFDLGRIETARPEE